MTTQSCVYWTCGHLPKPDTECRDRIRFNPETIDQPPKRQKTSHPGPAGRKNSKNVNRDPNSKTEKPSLVPMLSQSSLFDESAIYIPAASTSSLPLPSLRTELGAARSELRPSKPSQKQRWYTTPDVPIAAESRASIGSNAAHEWRSSLCLDAEGQIVVAGSISGLPMLEQLGALDHFDISPVSTSEPGSTSQPPGLRGGAGALPLSFQEYKRHSTYDKEGLYEPEDDEPYILSPLDTWALVIHTCPIDLLNALVQQYLSTCEALFPILHHPTFLKIFNAVSGTESEAEGCSSAFGGLLMAICAVASRSSDDDRVFATPGKPLSSGECRRLLGTSCIPSAIQWSTGLHYFQLSRMLLAMADSALDIRFIQATLLNALYAEGLDNVSVHNSLVGEAIALSLTAGLHRSSEDWPVGPVVAEERKRLFWALWNYEK